MFIDKYLTICESRYIIKLNNNIVNIIVSVHGYSEVIFLEPVQRQTEKNEILEEDEIQAAKLINAMHVFSKINIGAVLGELSQTEYLVIYFVRKHGEYDGLCGNGVNVTSLSEVLGVSTPAVSRILRGLEEKGFIQRVTNKRNRRETYISLTDRGREIYFRDREIASSLYKAVKEKLGQDRIKELVQLSRSFNLIMTEEIERMNLSKKIGSS